MHVRLRTGSEVIIGMSPRGGEYTYLEAVSYRQVQVIWTHRMVIRIVTSGLLISGGILSPDTMWKWSGDNMREDVLRAESREAIKFCMVACMKLGCSCKGAAS